MSVATHYKGRLVQIVDQNGSKFEGCQKLLKSCILSKLKTFLQKFIGWYVESVEEAKILTSSDF